MERKYILRTLEMCNCEREMWRNLRVLPRRSLSSACSSHSTLSSRPSVAVNGRAVAKRDAREEQRAAFTVKRHGIVPAISSSWALECRAVARALPRGRSSMWNRSSGSDGGGSVTPRFLRLPPRHSETTSARGEPEAARRMVPLLAAAAT